MIIGVGTRYTDFTTASHTVFGNPEVRFVNINVACVRRRQARRHDGGGRRQGGPERADATRSAGYAAPAEWQARATAEVAAWAAETERCYHRGHGPLPAQTEVFGALNELMGDDDILSTPPARCPGTCSACGGPGRPVGYHLEYGYSCMGYEVPAAIGAKLARPESEVVAIVGDGGWQMMPTEILTAVAEGVKVIYVLLQNHGFASIGALSESRGSQRFGTRYRMRNPASGLPGRRPCCRSTSPRTPRASARTSSVAHGIDEFREGLRPGGGGRPSSP